MAKPKPTKAEREQENAQHQLFVEEYFKNNMHGGKAATAAGYSPATAYAQASRLLKNVKIRAEIDSRLKTMQLDSNEVLSRLSQHATGTLRYFVTPTGEIDLTTPEAQDHFHLLKKIKRTGHRDGSVTIEIEVHDPQSALVQVGKYHKLFTDKVEHSGAVSLSWADVIKAAEQDDTGSEAGLKSDWSDPERPGEVRPAVPEDSGHY